MKVLITGSSGMLGQALIKELAKKYEVIGIDIIKSQDSLHTFIECDITNKEKTIAEITSLKPEILIHTAAYTDVDGCEINPVKANQINAEGTKNVALACEKIKALLCYISTDFVFDGKKKTPYKENNRTNPINVYGRTKWEGERFIQALLKEYLIVRSSWLFGKGGKNFIDTIIQKVKKNLPLEVVNDQVGSPTYSKDLALGLSRLLSCFADKEQKAGAFGIYHLSNQGSCSRYDLAKEILKISKLEAKLTAIISDALDKSARRPKMSVLDNSRFEKLTQTKMRSWQVALEEYIKEVY